MLFFIYLFIFVSISAHFIIYIDFYLEADVTLSSPSVPPLSSSLARIAGGYSPARSPGKGRLSSAWQAAGGPSMRRRKLNYRSCCPLCKQDKSQWYGQLHLNTTHVYSRLSVQEQGCRGGWANSWDSFTVEIRHSLGPRC